jgi:hypothetical protein
VTTKIIAPCTFFYVYIDEDEGSDKEASMESETEQSTGDEETSESETVSGSPSGSEEVIQIFFYTRSSCFHPRLYVCVCLSAQ